MKLTSPNRLQQIHVSRHRGGYEPVASYKTEKATDREDHEDLQLSLLQLSPAGTWRDKLYTASCPRPMLVTAQHQQQWMELHEAMVLAITDIIERWWTDPVARFPERMPLEPKEEELLRVLQPTTK
jgi:hypothetical protein